MNRDGLIFKTASFQFAEKEIEGGDSQQIHIKHSWSACRAPPQPILLLNRYTAVLLGEMSDKQVKTNKIKVIK